jgi:hypothetical protein
VTGVRNNRGCHVIGKLKKSLKLAAKTELKLGITEDVM